MKCLRKIVGSDVYKDEEEIQVVVRCLMSLPLLPLGDIPQGFEDIKTIFSDDSPSKTALEQLIHYACSGQVKGASESDHTQRLSVRDKNTVQTTS